jgi:hypothetical protein
MGKRKTQPLLDTGLIIPVRIFLISNLLQEIPKWNRIIETGGLHRIPALPAHF